jgi:hypothetical protein
MSVQNIVIDFGVSSKVESSCGVVHVGASLTAVTDTVSVAVALESDPSLTTNVTVRFVVVGFWLVLL